MCPLTTCPTAGKHGVMTAKEALIREVLELDEAEAAQARIVVGGDGLDEVDVVGMPEEWGTTLTGEPMPNIVAAVRRSRASH